MMLVWTVSFTEPCVLMVSGLVLWYEFFFWFCVSFAAFDSFGSATSAKRTLDLEDSNIV